MTRLDHWSRPTTLGDVPLTPSASPAARLRRLVSRGRARWLWQPDKGDRLTTVAALLGSDRAVVADVGGRGHGAPWPGGRACGGRRSTSSSPATCWSLPGRSPSWTMPSTAVSELRRARAPPCGRPSVAATSRSCCASPATRVRALLPGRVQGQGRLGAPPRRPAGEPSTTCSSTSSTSTSSIGLPRVADVVATVGQRRAGASVRVHYQDGVLEGEKLLIDAVHAVKGRRPARRCSAPRARGWCAVDRCSPRESSPDNNRAYVVIDLAPPAPRRPRRRPGRACCFQLNWSAHVTAPRGVLLLLARDLELLESRAHAGDQRVDHPGRVLRRRCRPASPSRPSRMESRSPGTSRASVGRP